MQLSGVSPCTCPLLASVWLPIRPLITIPWVLRAADDTLVERLKFVEPSAFL